MKTFSFFLFWLTCLPAYAYIGPGTGAGVLASVLGVIGSLVLIIVGLVYYPIKRMLKKRKQASVSPHDQ
jgi:hypothetical protein